MTKFGAYKSALQPVLDKMLKVTPSSSSVPILSYIRVDAEPDSLTLTATDLKSSLVVSVPHAVVSEPGALLLPAQKLSQILRSAVSASLLVKVDDGSDLAMLQGGPTRWNLNTLPVSMFPDIPQLQEAEVHEVDRQELLTALNAVRSAAATESFRPNLMQIGISSGKVRASDGIRYHEASLGNAEMIDIAIPAHVLEDLIVMFRGSSSATVEIGVPEGGTSLIFHVDDDVLTTRCLTSPFPDVAQAFLIPTMANKDVLKVSREALRGALRRVRITSEISTQAVTLEVFKEDFQRMDVSARQKDGSWSQETVSVEWPGGDRKLMFNHEHLSHLLTTFDSDDLELRLGPDQKAKPSPVLIQADGRSGVLNQLRMEWAL